MDVDKIMLTDAPLLFPPGQVKLLLWLWICTLVFKHRKKKLAAELVKFALKLRYSTPSGF